MRAWQDGISDIWHLALTLSVTKTWSYLGTCSGMLYFKYANPIIMHGLIFQTQKWLDQITNLQSSYANNRGHQIKDLISCICFVWFTNTETIVGNVCIYREMRHWIKIPELSEALFRKSVLDCKPRGDLCPCSLIGNYPWPLDCNFLWKDSISVQLGTAERTHLR